MSYDIEAIKAHNWRQIVIIYEERGLALGLDAQQWLEEILEEGNLSYHPAYQTTSCVIYKKHLPYIRSNIVSMVVLNRGDGSPLSTKREYTYKPDCLEEDENIRELMYALHKKRQQKPESD